MLEHNGQSASKTARHALLLPICSKFKKKNGQICAEADAKFSLSIQAN